MWRIIVIIFLSVFSLAVYGQSVTIGLKGEIIEYFTYRPITNTIQGYGFILPFGSAYLKVGINYREFVLDLKAGFQIGDPYQGGDFGAAFKYKITEHISPLITFLTHINTWNSHNSGGTYTDPINFIGTGAETKFTKLFGLDLIFYLPVGNKNLEYTFPENSDDHIVYSRMGLMIKLGFIFDILEI